MDDQIDAAYQEFFELLDFDDDLGKFTAICRRVCAYTTMKPKDVAHNINLGRADMNRMTHETWLINASANEIADAMIAGKY